MVNDNYKGTDMIVFRDFLYVINESLLENGVGKGDELFVVGNQPVQEDEKDPYNLRVKLIVCKVNDTHIDSTKFLLIDPKNVVKVSEVRQNLLTKVMQEDFAPEDNGEAPSDVTVH